MRVRAGVFLLVFCVSAGCFGGRSQSKSGGPAICGGGWSAGAAGWHAAMAEFWGRRLPRRKVVAIFQTPGAGAYQIQVLAPGFAAATVDVSSQTEITVSLKLATASETVVVSGMRAPVPAEAAGADVDSLSAAQLTTIQPIAASDAIRFLPGAVVNNAGQRGGLTSLFVRGGESRYNKVIVDGVTINEPGGTFDFGTLRLDQADRMEFVRGAQSTLYGSDAMTSVVQVWTQAGSTRVPELSFGADGGNFGTAQGYAALAGARGPFRLQPVRQPAQYEWRRHQQRLLGFAGGRECWSRDQRSGFLARAGAAFE